LARRHDFAFHGAVDDLRRLAVATATALALAVGSGVAEAGPGPPLDPARKAEAKQHFDRGADLYAQGAYEEAIKEWMRSFEISGHPLIFESVANAQERLGRPREARESLLRWRDAAPREEQELLDRRLRNLDERIAKLEEEERAAAERKAREAEQRQQSGEPAGGGGAEASEPSSSPLIPIGLVVGGVGVGAVVAGLVVGGLAAGERPDEATACRAGEGGSLCLAGERDAIEGSSSKALVADILWIGGAALAATGVVLAVIGASSDGTPAPATEARAILAPSLGPGGGGATLRGSW
jgi:tetratricopeptide (TPR) repeat protein